MRTVVSYSTDLLLRNAQIRDATPPVLSLMEAIQQTNPVLQAWLDHFEDLGRPLEDPSFNSGYTKTSLGYEDYHLRINTYGVTGLQSRRGQSRNRLIEQQPRCCCPGPDGRTFKVCPPAMLDSIVDLFNAISAVVYIPTQLVCGDNTK